MKAAGTIWDPNRQEAWGTEGRNPVPARVTIVPPEAGPEEGVKLVRVRVGWKRKWGGVRERMGAVAKSDKASWAEPAAAAAAVELLPPPPCHVIPPSKERAMGRPGGVDP